MTAPAAHPHVWPVLRELHGALRRELAGRMLGLYVTGSLACGDFDPERSDLDLVCVLDGELPADAMAAIAATHDGLAARHPAWRDRVEVIYTPVQALVSFRSRPGRGAVISPGEPLHPVTLNADWLINWHTLRERSVALRGPDARELIAPISSDELRGWARDHLQRWPSWVRQSDQAGFLAYAILTGCRCYQLARRGHQLSKAQAAQRTAVDLPHWAQVIADAGAWRRHPDRTLRASQITLTVALIDDLARLSCDA